MSVGDDELDILLGDEEEEIEEVGSLYPGGDEPTPKVEDKPAAGIDSKLLSDTLAGVLSSSSESQAKVIRDGIAQVAGLIAQNKPVHAPELTTEQIQARNLEIQTMLADGSGAVDIVGKLKGLFAPEIEAVVQGRLRELEPLAANGLETQGEERVESFKERAFKDMPEAQRALAEAEVDKLVPREKYGKIAAASAADRKAYFEEIKERVKGRLYDRALEKKSARNLAAGASSGGGSLGGDKAKAAFEALSRQEQKEALRFANYSAREMGFAEGTAEFKKHVKSTIDAYALGEG